MGAGEWAALKTYGAEEGHPEVLGRALFLRPLGAMILQLFSPDLCLLGTLGEFRARGWYEATRAQSLFLMTPFNTAEPHSGTTNMSWEDRG